MRDPWVGPKLTRAQKHYRRKRDRPDKEKRRHIRLGPAHEAYECGGFIAPKRCKLSIKQIHHIVTCESPRLTDLAVIYGTSVGYISHLRNGAWPTKYKKWINERENRKLSKILSIEDCWVATKLPAEMFAKVVDAFLGQQYARARMTIAHGKPLDEEPHYKITKRRQGVLKRESN